MTLKILHFADAHIDIATGGKRDPESGFSYRTLDFLNAFDEIIDTAIREQVDLVLFAGDAYRDATPTPTFQREWDSRMMRLSEAKITTLLIPGNHDMTPTSVKANALQEFSSLSIPYIHIHGGRPRLWTPADLDNVPVQVITLPWIFRSNLVLQAMLDEMSSENPESDGSEILQHVLNRLIEQANPELPLILLAHAAIAGARYPNQQPVTLGREITLPKSAVADPRLTYSALGHIHLFQDLNEGEQPPVVYPGSIARVNFGESREDKGFVMAEIEPGNARYEFRVIHGRRFYNREITVSEEEDIQNKILSALPDSETVDGAMVRLVVNFEEEQRHNIDVRALNTLMKNALEFHLVLKPVRTTRQRIQSDTPFSSLGPIDLLEKYARTIEIPEDELNELKDVALEIFADCERETGIARDAS